MGTLWRIEVNVLDEGYFLPVPVWYRRVYVVYG